MPRDHDERTESQAVTAEAKYRLLLEILQKLSGTLDLEKILSHLLDAVGLVVSYDAAGIFVLNRGELPIGKGPMTNLIAGVATRGFEFRAPEQDPMLRSGKGIIGSVIRTGKSTVVPDVRRDKRYVEGRRETRSEIAVPIALQGRVIGALNLESDQICAFTEADVEMLQFFANAAAISIEKAVLHRQLLEKKDIERQLGIAREVQTSLLPVAPPRIDGYDIAAVNLPSYEIGGDYYDFIRFSNGHLGVAVADVSGKGIPAALIMATFRAVLRTQVRNDFELSHIMHSVNLLLSESIGASNFVTAVYGVLNPEVGTYVYSNCGHNPPVLLRSDGRIETLNQGGPALGVFKEAGYETAFTTLGEEETLVLFTDGVIETTDLQGHEFGLERLEEVLRGAGDRSAGRMIQAVIDETRSFSGREAYQDDFTLIVLKRR